MLRQFCSVLWVKLIWNIHLLGTFQEHFFPPLLTLIQTDALDYCLGHVSCEKIHIVEGKWKYLTSGLKTAASKGLFLYYFFEELLSTDLFPPKCKKAQFIQRLFCERRKNFPLKNNTWKEVGLLTWVDATCQHFIC